MSPPPDFPAERKRFREALVDAASGIVRVALDREGRTGHGPDFREARHTEKATPRGARGNCVRLDRLKRGVALERARIRMERYGDSLVHGRFCRDSPASSTGTDPSNIKTVAFQRTRSAARPCRGRCHTPYSVTSRHNVARYFCVIKLFLS